MAKRSVAKTIKSKAAIARKNASSRDISHTEIGGTIYEVISNYTGKFTFVDIFKGAINRNIESEKLTWEEDRYAKTQSKKRRRISEAVPQ